MVTDVNQTFVFLSVSNSTNNTRSTTRTSSACDEPLGAAPQSGRNFLENVSYFATGTYSPLDSAPYQMAIAKFNAAGYTVVDQELQCGPKGLSSANHRVPHLPMDRHGIDD
jgi:hypothetical protein